MAPTGSQILAVKQKDLSSKAGRKKHERRYGPRNQENRLLTQRNTIFDNYTADGGEKKITVIEFEDEDELDEPHLLVQENAISSTVLENTLLKSRKRKRSQGGESSKKQLK